MELFSRFIDCINNATECWQLNLGGYTVNDDIVVDVAAADYDNDVENYGRKKG